VSWEGARLAPVLETKMIDPIVWCVMAFSTLVIAGSFASDSIRHWHDYLRWLRERKTQS
jgi:putative intracellular protease/amidase